MVSMLAFSASFLRMDTKSLKNNVAIVFLHTRYKNLNVIENKRPSIIPRNNDSYLLYITSGFTYMYTEYVGLWKTVFLKMTTAIFLVFYGLSDFGTPHH